MSIYRAILVDNPSKLGPELSGRRGVIAARKAGMPSTVLKTKTKGFAPSMPSSPALNAISSPAPNSVTSVPKKPKSIKKDPLFIPLIHLLALGREKEKTLAMKTHTTISKCAEILINVANRVGSEHWQLQDDAFKNLDVWKFPYLSQDDRDKAIENATKAFDRLNLPDMDQPREMLRKPEDRGKPLPPKPKPVPVVEPEPVKKPMTQSSPPVPPTIKISQEEPSFVGSPALSSEPMARAASQPNPSLAKAPGSATNNALKKLISGKKTAKAKAAPTPKMTTAAVPKDKKVTTTKVSINTLNAAAAAAGTTPKISVSKTLTPATATTSTATSTTTAATGRKGPAPKVPYKSAEFISDSDSDSGDSSPPEPLIKTSAVAQKVPMKTAQKSVSRPNASPNVGSKRPPSTSISGRYDATPSNHASSPYVNGHKHSNSMSASPQKPSPLGSSPPLTASDVVRPSSTASSSPLSSIATPDELATPPIHTSAYTSVPNQTPKSSAAGSSKPRYIPGQTGTESPREQKRKAEPEASERPRKRVMSSSSDDSEIMRRRKAHDEDHPTSARKAPKTSESSKYVDVNGSRDVEMHYSKPKERDIPRASYASSTTSTASSVSMSSSASSTKSRNRSQPSEESLELLAKYRRMHIQYQNKYERIQSNPNIPDDEFDHFMTLHKKLATMKTRIASVMAY